MILAEITTKIVQIDHALFYFFNHTAPHWPWLAKLAILLDFVFAKGLFWIGICLIMLISKKSQKIGLWGLINLALVAAFEGLLLKNLFARPRPYHTLNNVLTFGILPKTYSFPSGHTTTCMAMAAYFWLTLPKSKLKYFLLLLAIIAGISRIYLGVHWPTDVVGGMIIGWLSTMALDRFFNFKKIDNIKKAC